MSDTLLIDLSADNIGESVQDKNGHYTGQVIMHDFDWGKSQTMGVQGAIIKATQGMDIDPGFDILMGGCTLEFKGPYGFLDYNQNHYDPGQEIAWGQKCAHLLLETAAKFSYNIRVAFDWEQNAYWEPLNNLASSKYSIARGLKMLLSGCNEVYRLMKYWPIIYTNAGLAGYMYNFLMCPFWYAIGNDGPVVMPKSKAPLRKTWTEADIIQFDWQAPGQKYGNFTGNPYVDRNHVPDISKITIPSGQTATPVLPTTIPSVPVQQNAIVVAPQGVRVHTGIGINAPQVGKLTLPCDPKQIYAILDTGKDLQGNPWLKINQGWICQRWGLTTLVKVN